MKIQAIAFSTFGTLVRNKAIILFCAIFVCVLLLVMSPLANMRNAAAGEQFVLGFVSTLMSMVSGFGSLLAAWSAAEAVSGEMKSGTILAVMARPVQRWEFLLGKYLGVQLLMLVYVAFMLCMSYTLAALGGQTIHASPWMLIVYPMVRYAIYSALAMLLVTMIHPTLAFTAVLITSVLALVVTPGASAGIMTDRIWMPLYAVLPSMELLSESQYLGMTQAAIKPVPWTTHLTALTYGLDYAVVFFLFAVWAFRRRALTRD
jgi:ABC-type transport system involved in multi-copper enzyme maturation permease subunit